MKYDKTTIIGLSTCVLLFLLWPRILLTLGLVQPPGKPANEPATPNPPAAVQRDTSPSEPASQTPAKPDTAAPKAQTSGDAPAAETTSPMGANAWSDPWPKPTDIPTRLTASKPFTVEVDPDGGGIVAVALKHYDRDFARGQEEHEPVVLGRWDHPFLALNVRRTGFVFGPAEEVLSKPDQYVLRRRTAAGLSLTETWSVVEGEPYRIQYSASFRNETGHPITLQKMALEAGAIPPSVGGRAVKARGMASGGVSIAFVDGGRPTLFSLKKVMKLKADDVRKIEARPSKWVAVHSQYFLMTIIAGEMADDALFTGVQMDLQPPPGTTAPEQTRMNVWFNARGLLPAATLAAGEETTLHFTGVAGPKEKRLLSSIGGRLDSIIGMDRFLFWHPRWMGFLTGCLLWLLVWLNNFFGVSYGYGLAIIVITVAVKTLFWPLTHHSTKSMRRMQELQPQLKELRERYKDDSQKLYRKQSEFLKENNVSQLGGCLPMLLQLPVFFALFITFRSAIELRHASFLWATDLSMPDDIFGLPIRPLAILMGLTMLLQQKLTPSSGDPQQKRMMMFMSAFFIFLFYGMPSGLTLYWTVNQILSIGQTLVTHRLEKRRKILAASPG